MTSLMRSMTLPTLSKMAGRARAMVWAASARLDLRGRSGLLASSSARVLTAAALSSEAMLSASTLAATSTSTACWLRPETLSR